jgi:hypothetical protein
MYSDPKTFPTSIPASARKAGLMFALMAAVTGLLSLALIAACIAPQKVSPTSHLGLLLLLGAPVAMFGQLAYRYAVFTFRPASLRLDGDGLSIVTATSTRCWSWGEVSNPRFGRSGSTLIFGPMSFWGTDRVIAPIWQRTTTEILALIEQAKAGRRTIDVATAPSGRRPLSVWLQAAAGVAMFVGLTMIRAGGGQNAAHAHQVAPNLHRYGAISVSDDFQVGETWGYHTIAAAQSRAQANCQDSVTAQNCQVKVAVYDACAAAAFSPSRRAVMTAQAATATEAQSAALKQCAGADCTIIAKTCSFDPY